MRRATLMMIGLVLLTGCGSTGPRPGLAVEVAGQRVSTGEIDRLTRGLCTVLQEVPESGLTTASMGDIREQVVTAVAIRTAAEAFAEERGLEPGADYTQAVRDLRSAAATVDRDLQDVLVQVDAQTVNTYISSITGSGGVAEFTGWLAEHPLTINPAYGLEFTGEGFDRLQGLSVPVSAAATDERAAADLPAAQRCDA